MNQIQDSATMTEQPKTMRRGLLALLGGITAAAALKASGAKATTNATLSTASTADYGALASPGAAGAPIEPTLTGTNHGVIGSNSALATLTMSSGVAGARNGAGIAGVLGVNAGDGFGVVGMTVGGIAVQGNSTSGAGAKGLSQDGVGVIGRSTNNSGVNAISDSDTKPALLAQSNGPTKKVAGLFKGDVRVQGAFQVTGAKAAAVNLPDGTLVTMYSQESPEAFFEDFGRAQLTGGIARIGLESEFAGLIHRENLMVFLTPEGDCNGLFVSARDRDGFEVKELKGGKSDIAFTYRLVGKRKDIPGERLARLDPMNDIVVSATDDDLPKPVFRGGSDDAFPSKVRHG